MAKKSESQHLTKNLQETHLTLDKLITVYLAARLAHAFHWIPFGGFERLCLNPASFCGSTSMNNPAERLSSLTSPWLSRIYWKCYFNPYLDLSAAFDVLSCHWIRPPMENTFITATYLGLVLRRSPHLFNPVRAEL